MAFLTKLTEILLDLPFDETWNYALYNLQCQEISSYFISKLERLFGTTLRSPSLTTGFTSPSSKGRNSFSVFYDKKLPRLWSNRKHKSSPIVTLNEGHSVFAILNELRIAPQAIEELYRVLKEAEKYLHKCHAVDWWRTAISIGNVKEARDVHIHDLMWCIAGLNLALHTVRGVELRSRAQFSRLDIARCYAEMAVISSQDSEMSQCEQQDYNHLLSSLQKIKHKYDEMNIVRKKVMNVQEKIKYETVDFLLRKLRGRTELESSVSSNRNLPRCIQINIEDLDLSSQSRPVSATVYEASWLGIKVSVKEFEFYYSKELFISEVATLIASQCPFVIQLYGWSINTKGDKCYLILELMNYSSLEQIVKERKRLQKPLHLPVVVDLMLQLSRAMEYLHSNKIIHKNLRPSNILIEPLSSSNELMEKGYGRVKLWNFGTLKLNIENSHMKTLSYGAPEVWAPTPFDQPDYLFESDVYSFAMSFAYCLTGEEPFPGKTPRTALKKMVETGMRPNLPANCPLMLKELLTKCWSTDPWSRPSFSTITMMLRQLKLLIMKARTPDQLLDSSMEKEYTLSTPTITFTELSAATNEFADKVENILTHTLYHGVLPDGTKILVQDYCESIRGGINMRKLWMKVSQLLNLRHSNVVSLRAVSIHASKCWFIYEDMASVIGSLDAWLCEDTSHDPLDIASCYRIALGAACGLQYLHAQDTLCAVTAEKILLDENYEPVILIDSIVTEVDDPDHHQHLDKLHFAALIQNILSHLDSSGVDTTSSNLDQQVSLLQKVKHLCSEVETDMDEVVEKLESGYELCIEDNSFNEPYQDDSFEFQHYVETGSNEIPQLDDLDMR